MPTAVEDPTVTELNTTNPDRQIQQLGFLRQRAEAIDLVGFGELVREKESRGL